MNRFDTTPTSIPIVLNGIAPGFATHSAKYAYFFGFPTDYNMFNMNPTVPNITSHLALSSGIVKKLVAYIASGDPNAIGGRFIIVTALFAFCEESLTEHSPRLP